MHVSADLQGLTHLDRELQIAALQREVLEAVALGQPLAAVMELLCRRVEALAPEVICTVLAVDLQGQVHPLAAPSLPTTFSAALEGAAIGPKAGSCGTAAWRREPVEVTDIASDPLWEDYRTLAQAHGLAACWSTPIILLGSGSGRAVATFALYYRESRPVAAFHRQMVEACSYLCRIALQAEQHRSEIERLANFDALTGLTNRARLIDRASQVLHMSTRLGSPAALLLLDLDRFKAVKQAMGHACGDTLLIEVARRLSSCLSETDTLARLGDDEFALLLPGCTATQALRMAEKIQLALLPPLVLADGAELQPSASIGICRHPEDGADLPQLLKAADIAMHEAKVAGRGSVRYYRQEMNEALDRRMAMEASLRRSLASGRGFSLVYEPKLRLSDGALVSVEALLRWQDEALGAVPPDRFIPLAEECGLIQALDRWVLTHALAQLADWRARDLGVPGMAINTSALRFQQGDLASEIEELLIQHGLDAKRLTLEVTERLMLDEAVLAREQLQRLDALGVRLSVDDFGTGYSSLAYLKRLPVSELKLDKSFVRDLETDPDDRALASAVLGVARALDLTVVAEGVETEAQWHWLREAGCNAAQGWLFGKPMVASTLEEWIAARSTASQ